jgi:membrane fusion protein (multidrug efflux system)
LDARTLPPEIDARPRRARLSRRKLAVRAGVLVVVLVALVAGIRWWSHGQAYVSTDDAYVNAHTVEIAPQVGGKVVALHVENNQAVRQGDPLFEIDPVPYQLALERAEAQLALARQNVAQLAAAVAAADAQVTRAQAEERNAQHNRTRSAELVTRGFISKQGAEASFTEEATARAGVQAAQAALKQAQSALGTPGEDNPAVRSARAAVEQAQLDLERAHVVSPADGTVANLSLRPGNTLQPGEALFSVIASAEFWVDANFKETQLQQIRAGQPATVKVDMYPKHAFNGVVESVSGGSGNAFSLLPPQNATGNWVKVTQRVPVRVRITDPDPQFPLRLQTTASVEVNVQGDVAKVASGAGSDAPPATAH